MRLFDKLLWLLAIIIIIILSPPAQKLQRQNMCWWQKLDFVASTWGPTLSDFVIKQQRQVAGVSHKRWYYCSSEYWHWTLSGYRQCRLFDFPYSGIDVLTILQLRCAWTAAFETTSHRTDAAYCYTCLTFCGLAICALGTLSELALQKRTNRSRCRMSLRNHVLDGSALWRHLANATERSVLGGNVALETRQITSTTYLHFIRSMKSYLAIYRYVVLVFVSVCLWQYIMMMRT